MMNQISLDWDTLKAAYPMRPLTGALKAFMDQLGPGNTPCCVQMSHALGVAGCLIGERSNRRANSRITTPTGTRFYLLAVDEMKWFLEDNFGMARVHSGPHRPVRVPSGGGRTRAGWLRVVAYPAPPGPFRLPVSAFHAHGNIHPAIPAGRRGLRRRAACAAYEVIVTAKSGPGV
jgi:hypothetical protein